MLEHLDPDIVSSVAAGGTAAAVSRVIVSMAHDEFRKTVLLELEKCKDAYHILDKEVARLKTKQEMIEDDQRRDKKST